MDEFIEITEDMRNLAYLYSKKRIKYEYDRFGLDYNQRIDMILIGSIGQLVFKKYLDINKIKYEYEFQAGEYDDYDFKINGKIIEIKTSGFDLDYKNLHFQYNYEQYIKSVLANYYAGIQIFINGYDRKTRTFDLEKCKRAYIVGGFLFSEGKKKFKLMNSTYSLILRADLTELTPLKDLIENL